MVAPLSAPNELQLVRDRLGTAVGEDAAAAAFMAALDLQGGGRLPRTSEEIGRFVRGPLHRTLTQLVGEATAARVTSRLMAGSREAEVSVVPDAEVSGPRLRRPGASILDATTVGRRTGPVRLIVIARSARLAERLRLSVGADDVAVGVAPDPQAGGRLAFEIDASLVIIDGTDVPAGGADEFVDGLGGLPDDVLLLLWTEGGPDADKLQAGLEFCSLRVAILDRREGVQPLIDMIRAQRG